MNNEYGSAPVAAAPAAAGPVSASAARYHNILKCFARGQGTIQEDIKFLLQRFYTYLICDGSGHDFIYLEYLKPKLSKLVGTLTPAEQKEVQLIIDKCGSNDTTKIKLGILLQELALYFGVKLIQHIFKPDSRFSGGVVLQDQWEYAFAEEGGVAPGVAAAAAGVYTNPEDFLLTQCKLLKDADGEWRWTTGQSKHLIVLVDSITGHNFYTILERFMEKGGIIVVLDAYEPYSDPGPVSVPSLYNYLFRLNSSRVFLGKTFTPLPRSINGDTSEDGTRRLPLDNPDQKFSFESENRIFFDGSVDTLPTLVEVEYCPYVFNADHPCTRTYSRFLGQKSNDERPRSFVETYIAFQDSQDGVNSIIKVQYTGIGVSKENVVKIQEALETLKNKDLNQKVNYNKEGNLYSNGGITITKISSKEIKINVSLKNLPFAFEARIPISIFQKYGSHGFDVVIALIGWLKTKGDYTFTRRFCCDRDYYLQDTRGAFYNHVGVQPLDDPKTIELIALSQNRDQQAGFKRELTRLGLLFNTRSSVSTLWTNDKLSSLGVFFSPEITALLDAKEGVTFSVVRNQDWNNANYFDAVPGRELVIPRTKLVQRQALTLSEKRDIEDCIQRCFSPIPRVAVEEEVAVFSTPRKANRFTGDSPFADGSVSPFHEYESAFDTPRGTTDDVMDAAIDEALISAATDPKDCLNALLHNQFELFYKELLRFALTESLFSGFGLNCEKYCAEIREKYESAKRQIQKFMATVDVNKIISGSATQFAIFLTTFTDEGRDAEEDEKIEYLKTELTQIISAIDAADDQFKSDENDSRNSIISSNTMRQKVRDYIANMKNLQERKKELFKQLREFSTLGSVNDVRYCILALMKDFIDKCSNSQLIDRATFDANLAKTIIQTELVTDEFAKKVFANTSVAAGTETESVMDDSSYAPTSNSGTDTGTGTSLDPSSAVNSAESLGSDVEDVYRRFNIGALSSAEFWQILFVKKVPAEILTGRIKGKTRYLDGIGRLTEVTIPTDGDSLFNALLTGYNSSPPTVSQISELREQIAGLIFRKFSESRDPEIKQQFITRIEEVIESDGRDSELLHAYNAYREDPLAYNALVDLYCREISTGERRVNPGISQKDIYRVPAYGGNLELDAFLELHPDANIFLRSQGSMRYSNMRSAAMPGQDVVDIFLIYSGNHYDIELRDENFEAYINAPPTVEGDRTDDNPSDTQLQKFGGKGKYKSRKHHKSSTRTKYTRRHASNRKKSKKRVSRKHKKSIKKSKKTRKYRSNK